MAVASYRVAAKSSSRKRVPQQGRGKCRPGGQESWCTRLEFAFFLALLSSGVGWGWGPTCPPCDDSRCKGYSSDAGQMCLLTCSCSSRVCTCCKDSMILLTRARRGNHLLTCVGQCLASLLASRRPELRTKEPSGSMLLDPSNLAVSWVYQSTQTLDPLM